MTKEATYDLFLSYSRHDESLLRPMSQLLKLGDRKVFLDRDSITPGSEFANEIERAIAASTVVAVFWCCRAADSTWVDREIAFALQHAKKIVPVLLCLHTLPESLKKVQWIDMTGAVSHGCGHTARERHILRQPEPFAYPFESYFQNWWKANKHLLALDAPEKADSDHRSRETELIVLRGLMDVRLSK